MNNPSPYYQPILDKLGIKALNPMQIRMLEIAKGDQDVMLLSPTGSGKTLAYLLPIVEKIGKQNDSIQSLIISPTRELAMQIAEVLGSFGSGISTVLCYGGHPVKEEKKALENSPQIVIGTPGRINDHIRRGHINVTDLNSLIFDEFDKTLEMGFEEDVKTIVEHPDSIKQFIFISATQGIQVPSFVNRNDIFQLDYLTNVTPDKLSIFKITSPLKDKIATLGTLLSDLGNTSTLVFLNHRAAVERVHKLLGIRGIHSDYFHGGLEQKDREIKLLKFRNGSVRTLITTDLSSRGIDIAEVLNVVHYQLPDTNEQFIHRNGRTARMEASGNAFIIIHAEESLKDFMPSNIETYQLQENGNLPSQPDKITIELNRGKKDKVNKMDVLGFLTKIGGLAGKDVGLIQIKPLRSYAAVPRKGQDQFLNSVISQKIKGKSVKIKVI